jgi:hypothetical protein
MRSILRAVQPVRFLYSSKVQYISYDYGSMKLEPHELYLALLFTFAIGAGIGYYFFHFIH